LRRWTAYLDLFLVERHEINDLETGCLVGLGVVPVGFLEDGLVFGTVQTPESASSTTTVVVLSCPSDARCPLSLAPGMLQRLAFHFSLARGSRDIAAVGWHRG